MFGEREKQGPSHVTGGVCHDGKPPAFGAKQDSESAESFARSLQASNACVRRVAMTATPGLRAAWKHSAMDLRRPET